MDHTVSQPYMKCIDDFIESGETDSVTALQCITAEVTKAEANSRQSLETLFLIYCATLVFLMQAGFAMICSGCVRKKNVQNTILKNLLDVCGSSLAFYFVGYAFAFGGDPSRTSFIGNSNFLLMDTADGISNNNANGFQYAHWLFHFAFAATAGECNTVDSSLLSVCFITRKGKHLLKSFLKYYHNSYNCCRYSSGTMSNECLPIIQHHFDWIW
jgi:hypothetical protein